MKKEIIEVNGKGLGWVLEPRLKSTPYLVCTDGDEIYKYGGMVSEECARSFMRKLCNIIGIIVNKSLPHGWWDQTDSGYTCSQCHTGVHTAKTKFCPDCGAKMDKEAPTE